MIQELLGGSGAAGGHGLIGGERKIYPLTGNLQVPSSSSSPSPFPSSTCSTNTTTTPTKISSENQNQNQLRCPRCDSSNTKFCYYNNYNLTQPRHFCKTCRRYWTKGGALRNVPIGGGCRKNHKTTSTVGHVIPSLGKSCTGKLKTVVSSEIGKSSGFLSGVDHHELSSNPISNHLMALLRSAQNPNPNPNSMLNSISVKEEGFLSGSHISSESGSASGEFNARAGGLGLDTLGGQVPSIGLCSSSFWRNNSQHQLAVQQQQQNGFMLGEAQSSVLIPDQLYQRLSLKSSENYYSDYSPAILVGNVHASSILANSSAILELAPVVAGGEIGNYWNTPSLWWWDLQTTNGEYGFG